MGIGALLVHSQGLRESFSYPNLSRFGVSTLRLYAELLTSLPGFPSLHFASDVPRARDTYFAPETPLFFTSPTSPPLSVDLVLSLVSLSIFFDDGRFWVYD
jgi:hypothetical protein